MNALVGAVVSLAMCTELKGHFKSNIVSYSTDLQVTFLAFLNILQRFLLFKKTTQPL